MAKLGIYVITNILNNKKYVGSSINIQRRLTEHKRDLNNDKHHSIKLQRAWNKWGSINFKFELLEECSSENLLIREQYYLDTWNLVEDGYNICPTAGNILGIKRTEKIKLKFVGKNNPFYGKTHSEESKQKMSKCHKNKIPWNKGKKIKGTPHTEETKKKISASKKGNQIWKNKTHSEETKQKMSISNKLAWIKRKEKLKENHGR